MVDFVGIILGLLAGGCFLYFCWWLGITVPVRMARARARDPVIWVLISVFGSPCLAIFLLCCLGPARS